MAIRISMIATNRTSGKVEFRTAMFDRPECNVFMGAFMHPEKTSSKKGDRPYTVAVSYVDLDTGKFGTNSHTITSERLKILIETFNDNCNGIPNVHVHNGLGLGVM